jgi:hypothetical protein
MGKDYFEFLEEEYMGLTSQVQQGLKQLALNHHQADEAQGPTGTAVVGHDNNATVVDLPLLFNRCHAIYQQMRIEARTNREFLDRLTLYSVQLTALLEHYQMVCFPATPTAPETSSSTTTGTTTAAAAGGGTTTAVGSANNSSPSKCQPKTSRFSPFARFSPKGAGTATGNNVQQELTFTFVIGDDDEYDTSLL